MPKLFSSLKIEKILLKNNFKFISQKGSHKKFRSKSHTVILPDNKKEIPFGTFKSIVRQSGLLTKEFE